jgi:hypothetical protein
MVDSGWEAASTDHFRANAKPKPEELSGLVSEHSAQFERNNGFGLPFPFKKVRTGFNFESRITKPFLEKHP